MWDGTDYVDFDFCDLKCGVFQNGLLPNYFAKYLWACLVIKIKRMIYFWKNVEDVHTIPSYLEIKVIDYKFHTMFIRMVIFYFYI